MVNDVAMRNRAMLTVALLGLTAACSTEGDGPPIGGSAGSAATGTAGSMGSAGGSMGSAGGSKGAEAASGGPTTAGIGGMALGGNAGAPQMQGGIGGGGGSGGGAGMGGSAGGSAQPFVGCSLGQYQLCDDFEGPAPGKAGSVWTVAGGFPTDVVTDVVHSGTHAVRVKANGLGGGRIQENKTLPAKDYWLRVYIRLDAEDTAHEGFVVANGQPESFRLLNNNGLGDGPNGPNGKGKIMLDRTSNEQGWEISKTDLPKGAWHCWEWHETPTEIHTFLDGVEIADVLAQWPEPNINSLSFGFERYHDGGEGSIYYDDIALDTKRIGCN